ncbi:stage II sporulation protein M [Candidatus Pacearchaeota archaeon]|nr:MAG: stage II sporulation protein M [Candidatus Pacearchaeota archaeon]
MPKLSSVFLNPIKAKHHPFEILVLVFIYTILSSLFAVWLFPTQASIASVFLAIISALYFVNGLFLLEEHKERFFNREKNLLIAHSKVAVVLLLLFFGFLLAFTFLGLALPQTLADKVFSLQANTINEIKSLTGNATNLGTFGLIFTNNLRVMFLSVLLAMFYGAGAIFILAWNASVMGFVIADIAKNQLGIVALPHAFFKFLLHGIPEILGYVGAALAGGMIYVAILERDLLSDSRKILTDIFVVLAISLALLTLGAFIESFISPFV